MIQHLLGGTKDSVPPHPSIITSMIAASNRLALAEAAPQPDIEFEWPLRVLIVDDAASTRRFLRAVLEYSSSFDIAGEAEDGATAIELAGTLQPDVVLLDLSMPATDGSSALGGIMSVAPNTRVIIVSGMSAAVASPLLAAGAVAFIEKGLAPFSLLERLSTILERPVTRPEQAVARSTTSGSSSIGDGELVGVAFPRAIVCDDDPMARHLVTQVLSNSEVSVIAETDIVPNLLSVVRLAKPELVVLDLWLEGTTGTSALPELRAASPQTAIVVYSGFTEWREVALANGAAAFVAKPQFDELGAAISRLTARKSA